jgi:hypothetical protein
MMIGCTGHQTVPADALIALDAELDDLTVGIVDVAGVCCLAAGADQGFAIAVVRRRWPLHVIVPAADYADTFGPADRDKYKLLLNCAATIDVLPYPKASEAAYMAGGIVVVERADVLVALWDGQPARGLGGSGDVVAYARSIGKSVKVIDARRPS